MTTAAIGSGSADNYGTSMGLPDWPKGQSNHPQLHFFPLQTAARYLPDNSFLSKAVAAAKHETRKCRQIKTVCRDSKKIAETNYDFHLFHISPPVPNKKNSSPDQPLHFWPSTVWESYLSNVPAGSRGTALHWIYIKFITKIVSLNRYFYCKQKLQKLTPKVALDNREKLHLAVANSQKEHWNH